MTWTPPPNLIPIDRRNPRTAKEADIQDVLAWLETKYGSAADGVSITGIDTMNTYHVQGKNGDGSYKLEKYIKGNEFLALVNRVSLVEANTVKQTDSGTLFPPLVGGKVPPQYLPTPGGSTGVPPKTTAVLSGGMRWVALGDSHTQGYDSSGHVTQTAANPIPYPTGYTPAIRGASWVNYLASISSQRLNLVNNAGLSGDRIETMRSRLTQDVFAYNPQVVTVLAGTNNLGTYDNGDGTGIRQHTIAEIGAAYNLLVQDLINYGAAVIVVSIPPWNNATARRRVSQFNIWLSRYARENGLPFLDLYSAVVDPTSSGVYKAGLVRPGDNGEGIHMEVGAGFGVWTRAAWAEIQKTVYGPTTHLVSVNNDLISLVNNSLFLLDNNSDGVAEGAIAYTLNGAAGNTSTEPHPDGYGNFQVITKTDSGAGIYIWQYNIPTSDANGNTWAVGDKLMLSGEFVSEGFELGTGANYTIQLQKTSDDYASILAPVFQWSANMRGTFQHSAVIPAGVTSLAMTVVISGGSGKIKFGRISVTNITALGG
jgi:lysophospholipase L1-like esterase